MPKNLVPVVNYFICPLLAAPHLELCMEDAAGDARAAAFFCAVDEAKDADAESPWFRMLVSDGADGFERGFRTPLLWMLGAEKRKEENVRSRYSVSLRDFFLLIPVTFSSSYYHKRSKIGLLKEHTSFNTFWDAAETLSLKNS